MNNFIAQALAGFRIPLGTLTFAVFIILLVESYVNNEFGGLRIFTLIIIGVNVIYLVVNKNRPHIPAPPQTPHADGDSQEA